MRCARCRQNGDGDGKGGGILCDRIAECQCLAPSILDVQGMWFPQLTDGHSGPRCQCESQQSSLVTLALTHDHVHDDDDDSYEECHPVF
jgi:hypothetical protein